MNASSLFQIGIRISAQGAEVVGQQAKAATAHLDKMAGTVSRVGDALGVAFTVGQFVDWMKAAVDAGDGMKAFSQKTGVAVSEVAGLQLAFKQGGVEGEDLTKALGKMSKQMVEGSDAFDKMGVKTRNADGTLRNVKDVLYDVADATAGMGDGAEKNARLVDLMGKSGAALIPTLNDGSESLRKYADMADRLGLSMSSEAAEAADSFNDTLELLEMSMSGVARQAMVQLLPTMNSITGAFFDSVSSAGQMQSSIDVVKTALQGLVSAGVIVGTVISQLGKSIGASAAAIVAVLSGDFSGAMHIVKERVGDFKTGVVGAAETISKVWNASGDSTVAALAKATKAQQGGTVATKEQEAAAKKAGDEFAKLIEKIMQRTAETKAETEAGRALTESEKNAIEITKKYTGEKLRLALAANDNLKLAEQEKKAKEDMAKLLKSVAEHTTKVTEAQDKATESLRAQYIADVQTNKELEQQIALVGLSGEELLKAKQAIAAREAAVLRSQATDLEWQAAMEGGNAALEEQARLLRGRAQLGEDRALLEAQKEYKDEWVKTNDQVGQSLTDALMQGGKSGWEYIKGLVRSTVLRPVVEMFAKPLAGGLTSLLGMGGMGNAMAGTSGSAAGGGVGSLTSLLGSAKSLLGSMGSWMSDFGGSVAFKAGDIGNWLMNNTSGGLNSAGGWMMENAGSIGDFAGMAGDALGYFGALKNAADGKWGAAIGSGIGTYFGGPIGAAIGNAIGGLADKLFAGGAGTQHTGSTATADSTGVRTTYGQNTGINFLVNGNDRNAKLDDTVQQIAGTAAGVLNSLGKAFGGSNFSVSTGFADDTSKDGAFGALKVLMNGNSVLDWESGRTSKWAPKIFSDGEAGAKEYVAAVASSVRDAINSIGLPEWAKKTLDALGGAPTLEQLTEAAQAIAGTQAALIKVGDFFSPLGGVFSRVAGLSADATLQLAQFAGGIDALIGKTQAYVQEYYSQDEQFALTAAGLRKQLADAGIQADLGSKEDLRALIDSTNVDNEAGRQQLAALLDVAGAFAPLGDYLKEQGKTLEQLALTAPQNMLLNTLSSDSQVQTDLASQQLDQLEVLTQQAESTTTEVTNLRSDVSELQNTMLAVAENTRRMAKLFEGWNGTDGLNVVAVPA